MDEIVAWLTGVLDEIAADTVEAGENGDRWDSLRADDGDAYVFVHGRGLVGGTVAEAPSELVVEHIARNDPRAVLARVEAERAVIADALAIPTAEIIIAELAYGHRFDAPGYQDSWAPGSSEETTT